MMNLNKLKKMSREKNSAKELQKLKSRFSFPIHNVRLIVLIIIVVAMLGLYAGSGFEVVMKCNRSQEICEISKSSFMEPIPVELGRFSMLSIFQVNVKSRVVENGKLIYDIQLDRGETKDPEFIDFGYNTIIKANTAKMKFLNYLEDGTRNEFELIKRCHFNDYFCS